MRRARGGPAAPRRRGEQRVAGQVAADRLNVRIEVEETAQTADYRAKGRHP
jgi:hypothetical protein